MNYSSIRRAVPTEGHLEAFAAEFANRLQPPLVVYLEGPLGAGKTTFVRALARALGYEGRVKSPTYGLLERYDFNNLKMIHLDLYRVEDALELEFLALRDLHEQDTILLIEWPSRGADEIPPADVRLCFSDSITDRDLRLVANSEAGESLVQSI